MSSWSTDRRSGPGQSVADRSRRTRAKEWLLYTGDRMAVSAVLLLVIANVVLGTVWSGFVPLRVRTPILFMLFALVSGNFVLITIVVSLNQFVLTRHLESPDEIRTRMDEMLGYRRAVGESTGRTVLPITPSGFLLVLFSTLARQGRDLEREIPETESGRTQDALRRLTREIEAHTTQVTEILDTPRRGSRDALFIALNTSYASYIHLVSHLETEHAEAVTAETATLLDRLIRSLEHVDVARRFLKTVFIQSALAELSRLLLYIGLPVQVITVVMLLSFSAPAAAGPSHAVLTVVIPTVVIAGFAPIVILTSFILRLSTIAERTAAMYPFTEDPVEFGTLVESDAPEHR